MINELLRWRKEATKEDWAKLAELSVTTTGYLDQIAYGWRRASPTKAEHIQKATIEIKKYRPVTKESLVFAPQRIQAA